MKKQPDIINDVDPEQSRRVEDTAKAPTLAPAFIPGIAIGRRVHYVLAQDEHRSADISNVLDRTDGTVNLVVHFDGQTDGRSKYDCTEWVQAVEYSEFHVIGTWHFIEAT